MTHAQTLEMIEMTNLYSDIHKDAYGFRSSADRNVWFRNLPYAEMKAEWDSLCAAVERSIDEDNRAFEARAIAYEAHITNLMSLGVDRQTAIRWDADAMDVSLDYGEGDTAIDWDYYRYKHGLRYNYELGEKRD